LITSVTGVVLLIISGKTNAAHPWAAALLVNLGTAILLTVPLLGLARLFEWRIVRAQLRTGAQVEELASQVDAVRQDVADVLDRLSANAVRRLAEDRAEDRALIDQISANPSRTGIGQVLDRAEGMDLVAGRGPRVSIFDTPLYARWELIDGSRSGESADLGDIRVTVERRDGSAIADHVWSGTETAEDLSVAIGVILRNNGLYPGDVAYSPGRMFDELRRLVDLGYRRATGEGGFTNRLSPIVQLVWQQWIITESELVTTDPWRPYPISLNRLDEPDWDAHMRGKEWVDIGEFRYAFETASEMLATGAIVVPPPDPVPEFDGP
jgi:hypothetical protein